MSCSFSIAYDQTHRFFVVRFSTVFVSSTVLSVVDVVKRDERYSDAVGVIWDLRNAVLSELQLGDLTEMFTRHKETHPDKALRVAAVTASHFDTHILRLWENVGRDGTLNTRRWFYSLEMAEAWMRSGDVVDGGQSMVDDFSRYCCVEGTGPKPASMPGSNSSWGQGVSIDQTPGSICH